METLVTSVLGWFCIISCGLSKLPQIRTIHKSKTIIGVSLSSILMELLNHGVQTGFYISESYPLLSYLEYPFLVLQNFVLLLLIGQCSNTLFKSVTYVTAYSTLIGIVSSGFFSKASILTAMSLNIPVGLSSKYAQVAAIRSSGTSDNVSYSAWVINAVSGMARIYTHIAARGETLILFNFSIMTIANFLVVVAIYSYRGQKLKST